MIDSHASERLKEMRRLLGISQRQVYEAINMNGGQYSEIEAGRLSAEKALKYVEERFKEWRKKEVKRLQDRIKYLNSLC